MSHRDVHSMLCLAVLVVGSIWAIRRMILPMLLGLFEIRGR